MRKDHSFADVPGDTGPKLNLNLLPVSFTRRNRRLLSKSTLVKIIFEYCGSVFSKNFGVECS